ncbi:MAG TPA: HU family DNA-binding protein [Ramlibacter sp.]
MRNKRARPVHSARRSRRAATRATRVSFSENYYMNRIELVQAIADKHQLSKAEAGRVLDTVIDSIVATVKKGGTVSLVGFGTFKQVARAARTGFNPQAGTKIKIAAAKVPKFTPGSGFKAAVDAKFAKRKAEKAAAAPKAKKAVVKKPVARKPVAKKPALRKAA